MKSVAGRKKGGEVKINMVLNSKIHKIFYLREDGLSTSWTNEIYDKSIIIRSMGWSPATKTQAIIDLHINKTLNNKLMNDEIFKIDEPIKLKYDSLEYYSRLYQFAFKKKNNELAIKASLAILSYYENINNGIKYLIKQTIPLALETTILNKSISFLVWSYYAADSGFLIKTKFALNILGAINGIIKNNIEDNQWSKISIPNNFIVNEEIIKLPIEHRDNLTSLILAKYFITEPSSRILIDKVSFCWIKRIIQKNKVICLLDNIEYYPISFTQCKMNTLIKNDLNPEIFVGSNTKVIKTISIKVGFPESVIEEILYSKLFNNKTKLMKLYGSNLSQKNKLNMTNQEMDILWNILKDIFYETAKKEIENIILE